VTGRQTQTDRWMGDSALCIYNVRIPTSSSSSSSSSLFIVIRRHSCRQWHVWNLCNVFVARYSTVPSLQDQGPQWGNTCNISKSTQNSFVLVSCLLYLFTAVLYDDTITSEFLFVMFSVLIKMVLIVFVLHGLNGQNNKGRSLLDKGSKNRE